MLDNGMEKTAVSTMDSIQSILHINTRCMNRFGAIYLLDYTAIKIYIVIYNAFHIVIENNNNR
jgi:hypothetical protein